MTAPDLYVYAILPAGLAADALGTGIDGAPLRLVDVPEGVAAVVHETTSGPYQGPDEDAKRWILEHSAVVERAWDITGTALPMTFNVLVRAGDEGTATETLRGWLRDSAVQLRGRLDALRDRVELRVDITLDRDRAAQDEPEVRALAAELDGKPAGVRRLLTKRLEKLQRDAVDAVADRVYPEYRRRLVGLAEDISEGRRGGRAEGQVPVLSAALLVHRDRVQELGAELARIQDEQPAAQIRFLGPWPPYSFSELRAPGASTA
ncbi:Gas vesicle synthesis protein GvpL/GvpF [Micromonospora pattaloongensis]|uniref:Gas vesicle synthesis protein GvpL/GvpF n=1 Tax=Micromonospora pattaloongensis TaxID=405436 RepID=A0A1H3LZX9_9ACTN|nr:GvpL/GvpF family gas vesicle protein [Micromonospora pattaloongensis]SDY69335.1 Gas vesicle synthesis protein GvpL/GvpF [Micromonospora pattaloongensis]